MYRVADFAYLQGNSYTIMVRDGLTGQGSAGKLEIDRDYCHRIKSILGEMLSGFCYRSLME